MPSDKWIKRRHKLEQDDENFKQTTQRRMDKRRERLEKPFGQSMAKRLFALFLIVTVGFGLYDVVRLVQGNTPGLTGSAVFGSLLLGSVVIGLPLCVLCAVQMVRVRQGEIEEDAAEYRLWLLITAGLMALLLVCWLISLVVG